jgi:hypothetical protein
MDFENLYERFSLHTTMRKKPSQTLKSIQAHMDNVVTPITGVSFDYSVKDLVFKNGDSARVHQHVDLAKKDGTKKSNGRGQGKPHDEDEW